MGCVVHHIYAFKGGSLIIQLIKQLIVKRIYVQNQNETYVDETDSKQPKYIGTSIPQISRKKSANQKSGDFCQKFVISIKKTIP